MEIQGFLLGDPIQSTAHSLVYRAVRKSDNLPVVLKILNQEYPSALELAQFHREFDILAQLCFAGVTQAHAFVQEGSYSIQVLEDFGAESLGAFLRRQHPRGMPLTVFLPIAIQIARHLGQIHAHNVVHKDINPANVLFNPRTQEVKITDFGISSLLSEERSSAVSSHSLEGTLSYISPEQTGRMNRWIDHRSDLYSLGMTFYELLSGSPAFQGTDPMELVHSHIAKIPSPIDRVRPELPAVLGRIVHKCIEKNAEDRYQSASGLVADLARCQEELTVRGQIEDFPIGEKDPSDRFTIPQKLYGREKDVHFLLDQFEAVCAGGTQLVLIAGCAGIGKSSLVQEIHKPVVAKRGLFVSGKFDPLKRDIPFAALVMGFQALIRDLMKETQEELERWKQTLQGALGQNGKVITDLLPELKWLIGEQPPVPELPPAESRNRLHVILQRFIHAFTREKRPLTLFVDDLQWADPASLSLLQALICNPENDRVLILAAYRDSEIDPTHPLKLLIDEIEKTLPTALHRLFLTPLDPLNIRVMVEETVKQKGESVAALAAVCAEKTGGNPFFLNEFLRTLHQDGLIRFDGPSTGWTFDLGAIQARKTTDNLADLMIARLDELSAPERAVLQLASCLGFQFDLHTLARLVDETPGATAERLKPALSNRLIIPLDDAYKYVAGDAQDNVPYQFHHDKIQQAAYSMLPDEERRGLHIRIGRMMLADSPQAERAGRSFEIANHFNKAHDLIADPAERIEVARLNLLAGQRAKSSAAYQPANHYFTIAISLFEDGWWRTEYELSLSLYTAGAQAAYLAGDFARMEEYLAVAIKHTRSLLDTVAAHEVRILALIARENSKEAVFAALEVLKLLGAGLSRKPSAPVVLLSLVRTKLLLGQRKPEDLLALPRMEDPVQLAAQRIIVNIGSPAFFYDLNFYVTLVLKTTRLSLQHGNSAYSCVGFAGYGVLLCGALGDMEGGFRFGQLALKLVDQYRAEQLRGMITFIANNFVFIWKIHIRETLPAFLEAYQHALEVGDYVFASHSAANYAYHGLFAGVSLAELEPAVRKFGERLPQLKQVLSVDTSRIFHQTLLNFMGQGEDPIRLMGEIYDEDVSLPRHERDNAKINLWDVHNNRLMLAVYFNAPEQALADSARAEEFLDVTLGLYCQAIYFFHDTLARCGRLGEEGFATRQKWLRRIQRQIAKMKKWTRHAPMNFQHKLCLMQAELARVQGRDARAGALYDAAIALAQEHGFVQEEALACELAGRFYLESRRTKLAQTYLRDAMFRYQRWGATAKVESMKKVYRSLMLLARTSAFQDSTFSSERQATRSGTQSTSLSTSTEENVLDLDSLLKASMTLSAEMELSNLVVKLMQILSENAGAERASLLFESEGELLVYASLDITVDQMARFRNRPLSKAEDLCAAIVRYVFRTRHVVVLGDAGRKGEFVDDVYIQSLKPKSILCLPILRNNQLTGVLYLENNQTFDAFTPARVEMLTLLASQAAISIDNARLYGKVQESKVQLEQALEEARESGRIKTEFLARTSHELRTPLNPIINMPRAMLQHWQPVPAAQCTACASFFRLEEGEAFDPAVPCPSCQAQGSLKSTSRHEFDGDIAQCMEVMQLVKSAGESLLRVVNNILDVSKLEEAQANLQKEPLLLGEVLDQAQETLAQQIRDRKLTLCATDQFRKASLSADRGKLVKILYNLIGNAIKFSPQESPIELTLCAEAQDDTFRFRIRDHGIGIAPEHQEKVFEPFFQVESGSTRKYGGTGLGLTVARKMAELHGGRIWLESEVGEGSTFYVELPIK